MPFLAAMALPIYILLLPFLMLLLLVPVLPPDDAWLLKESFTFLAPFSATFWYIFAHRLLAHQRSRFRNQFAVFVATVLLIVLIFKLGV